MSRRDTLRGEEGSTKTIRVLIVEDQRVLAEALALSLTAEDDIEVVGTAPDVGTAVGMAKELAPDVVVMDHHLPGDDGIVGTQRIHAIRPELPVIMLTGNTSDELLLAALNAGMNGFLIKDEPYGDLVASVRRAADGEVVWPAERLARLLARGGQYAPDTGAAAKLTPRERDVLALMCDGLDNKTIAARLGLSLTTVRGYVQSVLEKLGVHSKLEAVVLATRTGLSRTLRP